MKRPDSWYPEEDYVLRECWPDIEKIALLVERTTSAVGGRARILGLKRERHSQWPPELVAELIAARRRGDAVKVFAKDHNKTPDAVERKIRRLGLNRRVCEAAE